MTMTELESLCSTCPVPCGKKIALPILERGSTTAEEALDSEHALCALKHPEDDSMWQHCRAFIRKIVASKLDDKDGIEDAVHEILIMVLRGLHNYQRKGSIRSWIYTIVWHAVPKLNRGNRQHKVMGGWEGTQPTSLKPEIPRRLYPPLTAEKPYSEAFVQETTEMPEAPETPESVYVATERYDQARQAMVEYCRKTRDPQRNARILTIAFHEGRSFEEIAEELGLTPRRVRQICDGALAYIRKVLAEGDAC